MIYVLPFIILGFFAWLYLLVREKMEIFEQYLPVTDSRNIESRIALRKKLLKKYLERSQRVTCSVYRSLTGLSPEQAVNELERFSSEGFLHKLGQGGETAYYDFQSPYNRENIKEQINQG